MYVEETIKAAVSRLIEAGVDTPLLDAQLIMAHVLGVPRLEVIAHNNRVLSDMEIKAFSEGVDKRVARCPVAYIINHKEFYGLDFYVEPGVLIPRPETEILVEEVVKRVRRGGPVIADIGVGSGAIAVAIAVEVPSATIYGTEISEDAAKVAGKNIEKHQLADRVKLLIGDMLKPIDPMGLVFDAIVSNPPYIATCELETLQPEVSRYEPREALDGGGDGMEAYRRIFPESFNVLKKNGFVAVEIGEGEAGGVCEIALNAGYNKTEVIRDLASIERVVVAWK